MPKYINQLVVASICFKGRKYDPNMDRIAKKYYIYNISKSTSSVGSRDIGRVSIFILFVTM